MQDMHDLIETLTNSYESLDKLDKKDLIRLLSVGQKATQLIHFVKRS